MLCVSSQPVCPFLKGGWPVKQCLNKEQWTCRGTLCSWQVEEEDSCFSLSSCDKSTRSRKCPTGTWNLWWRRESGMKRKMTLLKLQGLHLQLNRCKFILRVVGATWGAYFLFSQELRGINWALQWLLILPVLIACSSWKMYNTAGSCLSFEEKLLKMKMSDMLGKCTT